MRQKRKGSYGAASIRELAATVGRSHTTVRGWLADSRWTFGSGPWTGQQVEGIRAWAAVTLAPNPAEKAGVSAGWAGLDEHGLPRNRVERAKLARIAAQTRAITLKNEQMAGQLHRVDECERRRVRQIAAVRERFLSLAAMLGDGFTDDQKAIIHGRLVEICQAFAAGDN